MPKKAKDIKLTGKKRVEPDASKSKKKPAPAKESKVTTRAKKSEEESKSKKAKNPQKDKEEEKVSKKKKVEKAEDKPTPKKQAKAKTKKEDKPVAKKEEKKGKAKKEEKKEEKKEDKKDDKKDEKMVIGIKKGKAVVDKNVPNGNLYHVYEENGEPYHCSLMWTDLKNNNNKFYIIQLLQQDANKSMFHVFNKWGRVGYDGQFAQFTFYDINSAKNTYQKKLREKTSKGYTEIKISFDEEEPAKKTDSKKAVSTAKSKLDERVQDLIKLIFNMDMMKQQMAEIGYDAKKMPLGKLSKETIKQGYEWLKQISDVIEKKSKGDLMDLSGKFFTVIPHDFGFQHMSNFVINTKEKVKAKLDMVQSLGDIEIATRLLEAKTDDNLAEVDNNYAKLKCAITPVEKSDPAYNIAMDYIINTHGDTHYFKLNMLELFKLDREGESERYNEKIGNDLLLWHGSRLTNFVGIISQGLRIAPPEAPVSGYMFGKGLYFADMVSKSANYCCAGSSNNIGLMILVKVAVGKPRPLYDSDINANKLPSGCHSTKGLGRTAPPETSYKKFRGMLVPCVKGEKVSDSKCYLMYNEFIVYDVCQAKLEYLLKMKFN